MMVAAIGSANTAFDPELEMERAIHREVVLGDLAGAMEKYKAILAQKGIGNELAARALLELARCQELLGRRAEARASYARVVSEYPDQSHAVSEARARLADWN
jgi:TolA-binding protein